MALVARLLQSLPLVIVLVILALVIYFCGVVGSFA